MALPNRGLIKINADTTLLTYSNKNANGDNVFSTPSYRMPIVIPDMKAFNKMPNVGNLLEVNNLAIYKKLPGIIPNAAPQLSWSLLSQ